MASIPPGSPDLNRVPVEAAVSQVPATAVEEALIPPQTEAPVAEAALPVALHEGIALREGVVRAAPAPEVPAIELTRDQMGTINAIMKAYLDALAPVAAQSLQQSMMDMDNEFSDQLDSKIDTAKREIPQLSQRDCALLTHLHETFLKIFNSTQGKLQGTRIPQRLNDIALYILHKNLPNIRQEFDDVSPLFGDSIAKIYRYKDVLKTIKLDNPETRIAQFAEAYTG